METTRFIIYLIGVLTVVIVAAYVLLQVFLEITSNIWDKERANKNRKVVLNFLLEKSKANWSDFERLSWEEEKKEKQQIKTRNFLYAGYILNKHNQNKQIFPPYSDKTSIKSCLDELEEQGLVVEQGNSWDLEKRFYTLTEKGTLLASQITPISVAICSS